MRRSQESDTYQSVACHDSTRDAARIASDVSRENEPMAACRPLKALPLCSKAMLPTRGQSVKKAKCMAENANSACIT